jgi:antitoxin (DNA-binding transcriptional repressor) of toxin-antitoxin stability system
LAGAFKSTDLGPERERTAAGAARRKAVRTVTVQEAQTRLAEIIETLPPGEELIITRDSKPVATIRATPSATPKKQRQLGTLRGSVLYIAPDFDAIPEGFEEYVD